MKLEVDSRFTFGEWSRFADRGLIPCGTDAIGIAAVVRRHRHLFTISSILAAGRLLRGPIQTAWVAGHFFECPFDDEFWDRLFRSGVIDRTGDELMVAVARSVFSTKASFTEILGDRARLLKPDLRTLNPIDSPSGASVHRQTALLVGFSGDAESAQHTQGSSAAPIIGNDPRPLDGSILGVNHTQL